MLGEGVVLLRFLWGFRAFSLKRFIGRSGCVVVRKVPDVVGTVIWCQEVEAGRRGRKSCASCSAATWWRAAGG